MPLATIEEAIADIRSGTMVIVMDDEDRENEGDLTMAAQMVTPEAINFMTKYGRGLICVPIIGKRLDELHIPMMVVENTSQAGNRVHRFDRSKEPNDDRYLGARSRCDHHALLDPRAKPSDFICPGHTFPLRARDGGVLVRAGQTEAAVDLARLAGLYPAGSSARFLQTTAR